MCSRKSLPFFASLAIASNAIGGIAPEPAGYIPHVQRTDREIYSLAELDGDSKTNEFVLVERATGLGYAFSVAAITTGYTTLSMSDAFPSGVAPIADAAVIHDYHSTPSLVTVSSDHNLLTLTTQLDQANSGLTVSQAYPSFFPLPTDIAPIAPANGGITVDREDVLVVSASLQDGIGLLNNASSTPQSVYLVPDFTSTGLQALQPFVLEGTTERVLGLVRNDSETSIAMMGAASANEKAPFTSIASATVSANASGYTFYPATAPDKEYLSFIFIEGDPKVQVMAIVPESISLVDSFTLSKPLAFLQALGSPDGFRLFAAYADGSAEVVLYDGSWNPLFSLTTTGNHPFLGVLCAKDGSFYALHGPDGLATHYEQIGYSGSDKYYRQSSGTFTRPSVSATLRDTIQAVAYTEPPFTGAPVPVQTYKFADWSSGSSISSSVNLTSLGYKDSTDGLFYEGTQSVGTLPAGASIAINQHDQNISLWFGSAYVGEQGPTLQIDPSSESGLTSAIQPTLSAFPGGTIFYRLSGQDAFSNAASGVPVIVENTTLEAYAVYKGIKGKVQRATYAFNAAASARDSDRDGLPDNMEMDIGSDPLNSDTDGDGSSDLADLLGGGQAAVLDNSVTATESDKQQAASGFASVTVALDGQAAYPSRETVIAQAADPNSGFASVIEAFNASDNSGNRSDAPLAATSGIIELKGSIGQSLGSAGLYEGTTTVDEVPIANPRGFVIAQNSAFSIVPEDRAWLTDFEKSSEGWQVTNSGLKVAAPTSARPDNAGESYARIYKTNTDSRLIIYDTSQSEQQWKGNYKEVSTDPKAVASEDVNKAAQVRAILCEVYSLDKARDGYLHLMVSNGSTAYISEGQFLPAFDASLFINPTAPSIWTSFLFDLKASAFSLAYPALNPATFEEVLTQVDEIAFLLSDNGEPDTLVASSTIKASTSHLGFAIDRIRAVGLPSGGYPMVAMAPVPARSNVLVPYARDAATSITAAIDQWITDFTAATNYSPINISVSPESTLVAILFEQFMNAALNLQDPTAYPESKQLAVLHQALGSPAGIEVFSADDFAFLRYPSASVSFPETTLAWEPQEVLADIEAAVAKNTTEGGVLNTVAAALYRIAATFTGIAPETYDNPLQTVYSYLNLNPLDDNWKNALTTVGLNAVALKAGLDEAEAILTGLLNSGRRNAETPFQLTIENNGKSFVDDFANEWVLLDRDGDPFLFPEQFAFPDGSTIRVEGFSLPMVDGLRQLEVTGIILLELPSTTPQDIDGNLLDDRWEILFFGATGVDPYGDPDGDGYNNISEFINGTDPQVQPTVNKGDEPVILPTLNWPAPLRIERQPNGDFWIYLPMPQSQADQFAWTIEVSNDLQTFSTETNVTESNGTNEQVFIIPASAFSKAFFRLKAELK